MEEALKKKVDTVIAFCRLGGGIFAIIGTLILFFFVQAASEPMGSSLAPCPDISEEPTGLSLAPRPIIRAIFR